MIDIPGKKIMKSFEFKIVLVLFHHEIMILPMFFHLLDHFSYSVYFGFSFYISSKLPVYVTLYILVTAQKLVKFQSDQTQKVKLKITAQSAASAALL